MTRVLICDDSPVTGQALVNLLSSQGMQCDWAASGDAALAFLALRSYPDGMLIDYYMPGTLDGLALLKKIRQLPEHALSPAVLMTAGGEDALSLLREELPPLAPCALLQKPFEMAELLRALDCLKPVSP